MYLRVLAWSIQVTSEKSICSDCVASQNSLLLYRYGAMFYHFLLNFINNVLPRRWDQIYQNRDLGGEERVKG